jgi:hypothetical protein
LLYFVIAEAVIVLATSCTSQITSRFMAASFERHMGKEQRLNRVDLGAKDDDVALDFRSDRPRTNEYSGR